MVFAQDEAKFAQGKAVLHDILPKDKFLVYRLQIDQLINDWPWMQNTKILINLQNEEKQDQTANKFKQFVDQKGN